MKFFRSDLHEYRDHENRTENCGADQIPGAFGLGRSFTKPGHGHGIAPSFPQRGRQDLNDPEEKCYLRNLSNDRVEI